MNSNTIQNIVNSLQSNIYQLRDFPILLINENPLTLQTSFSESANHHGTGFAGSIYSLAVMTGLIEMHLLTDSDLNNAAVVIGSAEIKYKKPITKDYSCRVVTQDEEDASLAKEMFDEAGKANTFIEVDVLQGKEIVGRFRGRYFATKK